MTVYASFFNDSTAGTNNIKDNTIDEILDMMKTVMALLRKSNPKCILAVSSVLPRPVDWDFSRDKVKLLNSELQKL